MSLGICNMPCFEEKPKIHLDFVACRNCRGLLRRMLQIKRWLKSSGSSRKLWTRPKRNSLKSVGRYPLLAVLRNVTNIVAGLLQLALCLLMLRMSQEPKNALPASFTNLGLLYVQRLFAEAHANHQRELTESKVRCG